MSEEEIVVVKSPIVPTTKQTKLYVAQAEEEISYENQVVYSVRLSNGMVITGPDGFPDEEMQTEEVEED
jgi:UDP-N-acetylmuramoylalanine-D-glutamate ligase